MMNRRAWIPLIVIAVFAGVGLSGCGGPQQAPKRAVPEVAVVTVKPQEIVMTSELPGRTTGYLVAEIRPQVNGLLQKRLFKEGSEVTAGQVLYEIDRAPYQAALDNATANLVAAREGTKRARAGLNASIASLTRHQAILSLAKTNLKRYENLLKTNAASAMQRDQAAADVEVADSGLRVAQAQVESDRESVEVAIAAISQAKAAAETARINLGYTKITAPISGRIGRSTMTEGAIVTAYQPTPLAIIQKFNPIYVDVPQSTVELNRLKRSLANGRLKENGTDSVKIILEDGTAYRQEGSLKFRDVTVDPTTGSVILRIVVPNPDFILLPGMFVRAIIDEGVNRQAILVPQQAVSRDAKGNPVALIVDAEGKAQPRPITTDRAWGTQWLVSSGLGQGDRVIVEGMQKVRPGMPVNAVPFKASGSTAKTPERTAQTANY